MSNQAWLRLSASTFHQLTHGAPKLVDEKHDPSYELRSYFSRLFMYAVAAAKSDMQSPHRLLTCISGIAEGSDNPGQCLTNYQGLVAPIT